MCLRTTIYSSDVLTSIDNAPNLISSHAKYGELLRRVRRFSITSVPYHPGAAKYFAEKGFDVATK